MKKVLLIAVFAVFALTSGAATNKELEAFVSKNLSRNPNVKFDKFTVLKRESVKGLSGWDRLEVEISARPTAQVGANTPPMTQKNTLYTSKGYLASDLIKLDGKTQSRAATDQQLIDLAAQMLAGNPNVKLEKATILRRYPLSDVDGFEAVQLQFDLSVTQEGKTRALSTTDVFFASKNYITNEIVRITNGTSLKQSIKGAVKNEYYRADHLIAGNANAKHKILLFSDPLCPACRATSPALFELAAKHPSEVAVYYYGFPTHSVSPVLLKAAIAAHLSGVSAVEQQLYTGELRVNTEDDFDALKVFNDRFKLKLTMADISAPAVLEQYNIDAKTALELNIAGTPTIFLDGKYDEDRKLIGNLTQELKNR